MSDADSSWESRLSLLTRARNGDEQVLNDLFVRYIPSSMLVFQTKGGRRGWGESRPNRRVSTFS